jgi:ferrous iron transport protein B
VTVEKKVGKCDLGANWDGECSIIDLPGTYSLASRSPDEHVARQVVLGQIPGTPRPDVLVVVCDASNLERNLFLVTQVLELGRPTIVALSMGDLAEKQGRPVNVEKLAAHLRTPVIAVQAHKGLGVPELKRAIAHAGRSGKAHRLELPLPEVMAKHIESIRDALLREHRVATSAGGGGGASAAADGRGGVFEQAEFDAHLMLSMGDDEDLPDPRRENPRVKAALDAALTELTAADIDPVAAEIEAHYGYIAGITADVVVETSSGPHAGGGQTTVTDRIDRVLTHKLWGMGIFVLIMGLVFVSIFKWAAPVMTFLQDGVMGGMGRWLSAHMADGPLEDLLVNGVIAGVGNVVVFLPQIALLFLFLAILEDSGYMSRAAFLMDRIMSKVGLHGKSFIPLLSGFACAVPAIMGTRVIENRRDRLATILVLPLMSCSARLPVYTLLIGTFFGAAAGYGAWVQGGILLVMYALGTLTAFGMAFVFKRTLLKGPAPAFILEMPPYRLPHPRTVVTTVTQRSWQFLKRAGTLIFAFSVMMWAATHYPQTTHYSQDYAGQATNLQKQQESLEAGLSPAERAPLAWHRAHPDPANGEVPTFAPPSPDEAAADAPIKAQIDQVTAQRDDLQHTKEAEELRNSAAGQVGRFIAPVFAPLGFDWKLSIGVTGAFFAREVIISTMGIVYAVGDADETSTALQSKMQNAYAPHGPLVALALMVFVVYCMQCLSTLAIVKRETGHWKWLVFMFVYMTAMAYIAALIVFQGGRALGF